MQKCVNFHTPPKNSATHIILLHTQHEHNNGLNNVLEIRPLTVCNIYCLALTMCMPPGSNKYRLQTDMVISNGPNFYYIVCKVRTILCSGSGNEHHQKLVRKCLFERILLEIQKSQKNFNGNIKFPLGFSWIFEFTASIEFSLVYGFG